MTDRKRVRTTGRGTAGGGSGAAPQEAGPVDARWVQTVEVGDDINVVTVITPPDEVQAGDDTATTTTVYTEAAEAGDNFADATGTATWSDDAEAGDNLALVSIMPQEGMEASDGYLSTSTVESMAEVGDDLAASVTVMVQEEVQPADTFDLTVTNLVPTDDAHIDDANPDTNFGSVDQMEIQAQDAVGNNEKQVLILFDLTGLSGVSHITGETTLFRFIAQENALLGSVDVDITVSTFATKPFSEDTVTWNNAPADGTVIATDSVSISGGSDAPYSISLTASEMDSAIGNWVMVRMDNGNTVDRPTILVQSKDISTTGPTGDSSGNGHTLTEAGSPDSDTPGSESKFGDGYDFEADDAADGLFNLDAALALTGDMAYLVTFDLESLPAASNVADIVSSRKETGGTRALADLRVLDDGTLTFNDNSGAVATSTNTISTGFNSIIVRRVSDTVVVEAWDDGTQQFVEFINQARGSVSGGTDQEFTIGYDRRNNDLYFDGIITEVRVWSGGTVPSLATLRTLGDPTSGTGGTSDPEGNEEALWYLETISAGLDTNTPKLNNMNLELN